MISEPRVIVAPGVIEAWKQSAQLLADEGERFNLTIQITNPCSLNEATLRACDPKRVKKVTSVFDVANTIFPPQRLWNFANREEFYGRFARAYAKGHKRRTWTWGSYFQRLIAFGPTEVNQVERAITMLGDWGRNYRAAMVLHLSASTLDKPRPLGAPCWQYGQFNVEVGNRVSLVAVYRSQDYFEKSLGNFTGLTRLLKFVCAHSGTTPGSLTCQSAFANLGPSKTATKKLLSIC